MDASLLGDTNTGVERYVLYLLNEMDQMAGGHGCRVTAFVRRGARVDGDWSNIQSRQVGLIHRGRAFRIAWQQLVLPLILRNDFDLFHAPAYVMPVLSRVPMVVTVHDIIALDHPRLCSRLNAWHYRRVMPASIRRAAHIITPTEWVRSQVLDRFQLRPERVTAIHEGVHPRFFLPPDTAVQRSLVSRYGLSGRLLLFVGNIEPKKNIPRMLRAFELLREEEPDLRLVLCGRIAWRASEFRQALDELRFGSDVVLTGYLPDAEIHALYSMADLFVFPSLTEGFGVPPLEAMACGTPVVAARGGAVEEVVGPAAVSVDASSEHDIASGIKRALTDSGLRLQLREQGLAHSRLFHWRNTAQKTLQVYSKVLGSRPGGRS